MSENVVEYWVSSSDDDFDAMLDVYSVKHYTWALFIGHLVIEKLLKGLYLLRNPDKKTPPYIHHLTILAEKSHLELSPEIAQTLGVFNTFNMRARYDRDKGDFHRRCTPEYTKKQIERIKEVRTWLKSELVKKS